LAHVVKDKNKQIIDVENVQVIIEKSKRPRTSFLPKYKCKWRRLFSQNRKWYLMRGRNLKNYWNRLKEFRSR